MRRAVLVVVAVLLAVAGAPAGRAEVGVAPRIDEEIDCLEPVPHHVDLGATPLDGKRAAVDVLVLLDEVSLAAGVAAAKDATRAYKAIGVDLRPRFAAVEVPADGTTTGLDGKRHGTASTTRALDVAKAAVGGRVPAGVEVVFLLTGKELYLGDDEPNTDDRSYAVAGLADCIGGIALAHRAFAVGEHLLLEAMEPVDFASGLPGKILAHEVGHLLGGHHHYANCVEQAPAGTLDRSADVCTLMFNDVSLIGHRFSNVNRAVVRGHAMAHAH